MKLVIFEGYNDLQFFRSFLTKQMNGKVITKENKNLIDQFKNLLAENPEMAKVEVISLNEEKLLLLSVGSKGNFKIIANGIKPLVNVLGRDGQNIDSILFVADKDAKLEVKIAESIINQILKIKVKHILYRDYLEDLILEIIDMVESLGNVNTVLKSLQNIIEEYYKNDKYIQKRKISLIHAVIGPRCFGHLFDEIFQFFDSSDFIQSVDLLSEFTEWLIE